LLFIFSTEAEPESQKENTVLPSDNKVTSVGQLAKKPRFQAPVARVTPHDKTQSCADEENPQTSGRYLL